MYICRCFVEGIIPISPLWLHVFCTLLSLSTVYLYMHLVWYGLGIHFSARRLKGSPQNRFPALYNGTHRGRRKRRNKTEHAKRRQESRKRKRAVKRSEKSQRVEVKKREIWNCEERGGGNGMLWAMLMSHYSTAEFVKWPDNSHLRPYASAFTHKDSHAARLMLPCLCHHCACVCSCSCIQVCVLLCLHSSLSGLLTVCVCACELM